MAEAHQVGSVFYWRSQRVGTCGDDHVLREQCPHHIIIQVAAPAHFTPDSSQYEDEQTSYEDSRSMMATSHHPTTT